MSKEGLNNQLCDAALQGNLNLIIESIQAGADVNFAIAENGLTPLHFSIVDEHLPCTAYLLAHGADCDITDIGGRDALGIALFMKQEKSAAMIIAHKERMWLDSEIQDTEAVAGDLDF